MTADAVSLQKAMREFEQLSGLVSLLENTLEQSQTRLLQESRKVNSLESRLEEFEESFPSEDAEPKDLETVRYRSASYSRS